MELTIGEAAEKLHLSIHTLRYYEKEGLLLPVKRAENGQRLYTLGDIQWIYMIRCLRDTGMSIQNIKQYLSLFKQGSKTVSERKEFLEQYKEHIDQQIRVFQTTRLLLEKKIEYYKNIETSLAEGETSVSDAGFNEARNFLYTNLSKELEMVQVHIKTLTELTKLFLPGMIERGYGRVLNMGSTGSYMPCPCDAVYAATKSYVLSFSNGLYQELKGSGVSVTCLCPGATQTRFAEKANINNTLLFKIGVMKPEVVAKIGYKSMLRGKLTVTAGLYNKLLVLSAKLLPVSIINPIAQWMVRTK